jgi:hypothetical protein
MVPSSSGYKKNSGRKIITITLGLLDSEDKGTTVF